ncbi:MAG: NTP transferase domain-containing protein [Phycisphaeraceae bacterium]|nr:NTP transferase domain-containing protein [Phycisphaeraceae bacterium]
MNSQHPVRKAVITAAGRGTRQYPASSAVQKEMFPIVDVDGLAKPVIQIIGEEAIAAGVEEICIVTQPGEEDQYRQYFRNMTEETLKAFEGKAWAIEAGRKLEDFGNRLRFVSQPTPEGYGHAVYQAREFVGDDPFLLMLGDHIYISANHKPCATQLIEHYALRGFSAMSAVQATPGDQLHLFGTLRGRPVDENGELFEVEAIVEKPDPDYARANLRTPGLGNGQYLCHFGMHVFPPAIFEALEHFIKNDIRQKGEIQLTTAQEYMRGHLIPQRKVGGYGACTIEGKRFDTGIPYGLMESQLALALAGRHRTRIVEAIARLLSEQLHSLSARHEA